MLSGVGPASVLPLFGLEVRADLPVGQGLQDHLLVLVNYTTDTESLMTALSPENIELLEAEARGPLTSNIAEAGGFFRARDGLAGPGMQLHMASVMSYQENLGAPSAHALAFGPCTLSPSSQGCVTLRSPNPVGEPGGWSADVKRYASAGQRRRGMSTPTTPAVAVAVGFLAIAAFQAALALGAPLGYAAWGGTHTHLPVKLRIASAFAVGIWVLAALIILGRAGFQVSPLPSAFARWGTWILVGVNFLGALMNFASHSNWERFLWAPVALILAVLCLVVALSRSAGS